MKDGPLFQERLYRRPFWMLVACVLVNRTRWAQAEPVHRELMRMYRSPRNLAKASPITLARIIWRLGFAHSRSRNLIEMARAWCRYGRTKRRTVDDVWRLPGCGKYAADSWAMFIQGRIDVKPTDKELRKYLRKKRAACRAVEMTQ